MECRLTKYTNPTNEYVFTDKSVHEASLSAGKTKSGAKELFRQSLKFLRNTFKMLPKIKTKKGSYSLTDDKSNKITSILKPTENYFKNADEGSNILRNKYELKQEPIFSRLDLQKTEYCDDAVMYEDPSSNQRKNVEVEEEPTYSTLEQLQQTNENTQTEAITFTPLTDDQIKQLYEDGLYAKVEKKNKKPKSQNPVPASCDNNLPPPVPKKMWLY